MKRTWVWWLMLAGMLTACRAQKTGCPTPARNLGAERVFDEMSKPQKKSLFRRRQ
ncbi:hypothetical protein ACWKWU_09475 [Chitinophaga lutea]